LRPDKAKRRQPAKFRFASTAELEQLTRIVGQDRGIEAILFGLEMKSPGYNIYLAGPKGTGKTTALIDFIERLASDMPTPNDWCYVNNFKELRRPTALSLPSGRGVEFERNMRWLVEHVESSLRKSFSDEEYAKLRRETLAKISEDQKVILEGAGRIAEGEGFTLKITPTGIKLVPSIEGHVVTDDELQRLPEETTNLLKARSESLQTKLRGVSLQLAELEKRASTLMDQLDQRVASFAIDSLFQMMTELYQDLDQVKLFLESVRADVLNNLAIIRGEDGEQEASKPPMVSYLVNLLVDNSGLRGAPVVTVPHPTIHHIFGYVEREVKMGTLQTDFMHVRGGAAHRANGGFLVIHVEDLFTDPYIWSSLKRAIRNRQLEAEDTPEPMEYVATNVLFPEPIPFDAKVIIIGDSEVYETLSADRDFNELFKVKADFDTSMDWNDANVENYARFVSTLCAKEDLRHSDGPGLAAIIEYGSRLSEDQRKLSTRFADIADIIREASLYAVKDGADLVSKKHIERALEKRVYMSSLIQEKITELISRKVILIDVLGEKRGQVNGLSVLTVGDYRFGVPNRITASVAVGKEGVVDIEREVNLGGPIHSKGVMILSGFLAGRYAQEKPLSLIARLVFEQSYSGVEGDSASSAELYAILSELSGKPIRQYLAVTGSVNQKGEVQAIGGVNEKIEGFYRVCKAGGLTGVQGVVIPASNVENLMLNEEIVESIKKGIFHVYPVETVDEGMEVLTGVEAGGITVDGSYERDTINYLAQKRLMDMAEHLREYVR
jgi:lon-related putative ATP-dependent protease